MRKNTFLIKNKYKLLLLSIVILIIIPPFFDDKDFPVAISILLTIFFLVCLNFISNHRKDIWISSVVTVIIIASCWLRIIFIDGLILKNDMVLLHSISGISFLLFIGYHLMISIYKSAKISFDIIIAAIIGYFFIGMIGSDVYELVDLYRPGSYSIQSGNFTDPVVPLYFSFVTLSTLGYGDIIPITKLARSFSILFTVFGQAYMTILVAIIVGKYIRFSEMEGFGIIKSKDETGAK